MDFITHHATWVAAAKLSDYRCFSAPAGTNYYSKRVAPMSFKDSGKNISHMNERIFSLRIPSSPTVGEGLDLGSV